MAMTVNELIERLQEFNGDAEVHLMTQPNWPFDNLVAGVCSQEEMNADEGDTADVDPEAATVVFIVEGGQIAYGNARAWQVVS